MELFSLEEKATQLPGGLFVFAFTNASVDSLRIIRRVAVGARDDAIASQELQIDPLKELRRIFSVSFVVCATEGEMAASGEFGKSREESLMFCDGCGSPVQPGQAFCSKCGKQIVGAIAFARPLPGRVQWHTHLLGILWLAFSALNAVGGVVLDRAGEQVDVGLLTSA